MKFPLLACVGLCLIGCASGATVTVDSFDKTFSWESDPTLLIRSDSPLLNEALMKEFHGMGMNHAVLTSVQPVAAALADITLKEDEREVVTSTYDPHSGVYSNPAQGGERKHDYMDTVKPKKLVKVTLATLTIMQADGKKVFYQAHHEFPYPVKNLNTIEVARTLLSPLAEYLHK